MGREKILLHDCSVTQALVVHTFTSPREGFASFGLDYIVVKRQSFSHAERVVKQEDPVKFFVWFGCWSRY